MRFAAIPAVCLLVGVAWSAPAGADTADYTRTPVLMVHGWFVISQAGDATWAAMKKKLVQDGWPEEYISTPSFEDVTGCDPGHAEEIAAWVDDLLASTGAEKVDVVAHSEGALNVMYYLKKLCGVRKVRRVVALAGAFHGTAVACLDPFSCGAKEMCIGSKPGAWKDNPVLADLMACDETPGDVLYTSVWSEFDEVIVPPQGSILEGADNIEMETDWIEHGGIFLSDESYGYVRDTLLGELGANDDGPGWDCIPGCAPPAPVDAAGEPSAGSGDEPAADAWEGLHDDPGAPSESVVGPDTCDVPTGDGNETPGDGPETLELVQGADGRGPVGDVPRTGAEAVSSCSVATRPGRAAGFLWLLVVLSLAAARLGRHACAPANPGSGYAPRMRSMRRASPGSAGTRPASRA